jgi:peptidoglycan/LPS O-acetylase OafA/YrhL
LFAECWVNVGFALIATRLTPRVLFTIIVVGWVPVAGYALSHGDLNIGFTRADAYVGLLRAIPSFACGVLIFKLWRKGALDAVPSLNPIVTSATFAGICVLPLPLWHGAHDLIVAMLIIPAVIVLLVRSDASVPSWALWLGRISYPLYATHFAVAYSVTRLSAWHPTILAEAGILFASILLADFVARWYEPAAARALASLDRAPGMRVTRPITD